MAEADADCRPVFFPKLMRSERNCSSFGELTAFSCATRVTPLVWGERRKGVNFTASRARTVTGIPRIPGKLVVSWSQTQRHEQSSKQSRVREVRQLTKRG
jgi:hypothetical protein